MKKHHQLLSLVAMLALLMAGDVFSAWTAPGQLPPNGNVAAPINVGTTDQIKVGGLGIGGLDVAGGAIVRGTSVTTDVDFTVMGKVGARQYCDELGTNCFFSSDVTGGGGSSAGSSMFVAMRRSGYSIPPAPGTLDDWPDAVVCEFTNGEPIAMYANAFGSGLISYRALNEGNGTIIYNANGSLYDAEGSLLKSSCGLAGQPATYASSLPQLCNEGRCVFDGDNSDGGSGGSTADGIGYDQDWMAVNRTQNVWYRNGTDKPIMVFHKNIWDGTVISVGAATTTAVTMNYQDYDSDLDNGSTIIIPPGHYYRFGTRTENSGNGHYVVRELR